MRSTFDTQRIAGYAIVIRYSRNWTCDQCLILNNNPASGSASESADLVGDAVEIHYSTVHAGNPRRHQLSLLYNAVIGPRGSAGPLEVRAIRDATDTQ